MVLPGVRAGRPGNEALNARLVAALPDSLAACSRMKGFPGRRNVAECRRNRCGGTGRTGQAATVSWSPARQSRDGFTLVELLFVLGLIGVMAGLAIPSLVKLGRRFEFRRQAGLVSAVVSRARSRALSTGSICGVRIELEDGKQTLAGYHWSPVRSRDGGLVEPVTFRCFSDERLQVPDSSLVLTFPGASGGSSPQVGDIRFDGRGYLLGAGRRNRVVVELRRPAGSSVDGKNLGLRLDERGRVVLVEI